MDIFSKERRSQIMSKISGKETKPEVITRQYLFKNGFRFRKNVKTLPGKPDIVLTKYKTVIFIHGCFWHHHTCNLSKFPQTNTVFWENKILANADRDLRTVSALQELGWKVITIWQCEIKNANLFKQRMEKLVTELINQI